MLTFVVIILCVVVLELWVRMRSISKALVNITEIYDKNILDLSNKNSMTEAGLKNTYNQVQGLRRGRREGTSKRSVQ